jgi:hypothetical protein
MRDMPKNVTGGCLCGNVRYEAEVFLKSGYYCHCRICQKSTGQPAEITVPIKAGSLTFVKSEPKYYVSSDYGRRGFCEDCGSRLVWKAMDPDNDWLTNVTVGSLDNPAEVRPSNHIYVGTQLPWYQIDEALPKYREEEVEAMIGVWKHERSPGC